MLDTGRSALTPTSQPLNKGLDRARARVLPRVLSPVQPRSRHSGIGLMTPATVHYGRAPALHAERARVLDAAYAAPPERFVRDPPRPPAVPTAAWINKPDSEEVAHQILDQSVSPGLPGSAPRDRPVGSRLPPESAGPVETLLQPRGRLGRIPFGAAKLGPPLHLVILSHFSNAFQSQWATLSSLEVRRFRSKERSRHT
jgi:hypothetical protein